ncbi:MAG: DUF2726 domain-containing protein [Methylacidiphilales bacterium]|nr:DUF2726 domain-containing protein [Candidatus Methylacidiphilales bacterium]
MIRVVIVLVILLIVAFVIYRLLKRTESKPEFVQKSPILSKPEQILYEALIKAYPSHVVLAQVSLNQVVQVDPNIVNYSQRLVQFNKINGKALDFVVCSTDYTICLAIELDDSSHKQKNRIRSDQEKDEALKSAGIKLIRFSVSRIPSVSELQQLIAS